MAVHQNYENNDHKFDQIDYKPEGNKRDILVKGNKRDNNIYNCDDEADPCQHKWPTLRTVKFQWILKWFNLPIFTNSSVIVSIFWD